MLRYPKERMHSHSQIFLIRRQEANHARITVMARKAIARESRKAGLRPMFC
jgi:hypothetical protein